MSCGVGLAISDIDVHRQDRIFAAAERAFVKHGFQGASMQAIAVEARMSAGNLYRYFDSKEAIVLGLVLRDQASVAEEFRALVQSQDLLATLGSSLRRHLVEAPIERHRMIMTIWAEMARNPVIRDRCGGVDSALRRHLLAIVEEARCTGLTAATIDPAYVVRLMATVVSGLFKRRATEPDFDGEAELALALGVFKAAFEGTLAPYRSSRPEGVR